MNDSVVRFSGSTGTPISNWGVGEVAILTILFLSIVYILVMIFYKGRKKTITITDKWVSKTDVGWAAEDPDAQAIGYVVEYCYENSQKKRLARCWGYIYDELYVGETYLVLKKFRTVKEVLGRVDT
ncbi:MAG: hypothetical protein FWH20_02685 [Oscillospiraceae bacterium]|nr:hypothetical protein [Oscillospiraceae bacterium]